ncbi:MAG: hypothetical protein AB7U79_02345 [Candidatus Izemoplasmatales bacterium]
MKINIYPIVSSLHEDTLINQETTTLLNELQSLGNFEINITDLDNLYNADLSLILVQSGGSENQFRKIFPHIKEPVYLLTYGGNNSLAASMEILTFLQNDDFEGEILHGSNESLVKRMNELVHPKKKDIINMGVIGKPSDWLIGSYVNYDDVENELGIRLVDIEIEELIDFFHKEETPIVPNQFDFNKNELRESMKVYHALEKILSKYDLKGFTIRCFDLLVSIHTTGCMALSLFNQRGIVATCEGDIPAMISMYQMYKKTGQIGFQANPSKIDVEKNEITFAHCTVPFNMVKNYKLLTHFESGIGVAIQGELEKKEVLIYKLSNNLKDYYLAEGKIVETPKKNNLCRTQIVVKVNDTDYFLKHPYGNHHVIVYK